MWKQIRFTQIKNLYIYIYTHFFPPLLHFSKFFQVKIPPLTLQSVRHKTITYLALSLRLTVHLNLFPTVSITIQSGTVLWLLCDCALWPSYFQMPPALACQRMKKYLWLVCWAKTSPSWGSLKADYVFPLTTVSSWKLWTFFSSFQERDWKVKERRDECEP